MTFAKKPMTIREACEKYYLPAAPDLAPETVSILRYHWSKWEKHTDNPDAGLITTDTFSTFRESCLTEGLAASTIEASIRRVLMILRYCKVIGAIRVMPDAGRRLMCRRRTPSQDDSADSDAAGRISALSEGEH